MKNNLKNHLKMEYPVALYMIITGKTTVSLKELNKYSRFLNRKFNENKDGQHILCSTHYLQEMVYQFPSLFQLSDHEVKYVGNNMSGIDKFKDLKRDVTAYLPTNTMISCIKYTSQYFRFKNQATKTDRKDNGKPM